MHRPITFHLALLTVICSVTLSLGGFNFNDNSNPGKVRLADIQVLTLHEGKQTTGRRSSPVSQLNCVAGSACGSAHLRPKTVQCRNQGSDGFDVQWKCEADLDSSVRFGSTDVTCEGYDYPEDPFVLKGSCGLEYGLEFVNGGGGAHQSQHKGGSPTDNIPSAFSSLLSMLCCVGLILFLLWMCSSSNRSANNGDSTDEGGNSRYWGGGPGGGGGGGFGGGGNGGPGWRGGPQSPPYSDPFNDDSASCGAGFNSGSCGSAPYNRRQPRGANMGGGGFGGPGFWSGLAAGGLMGYMFGGNRNRGYNTGYGYNNNNYGYHNQRGFASPFGGGGGAGPSWGGSSGGAGFSGGTRSASGFGGTRRR